jgi:hypothetical protein
LQIAKLDVASKIFFTFHSAIAFGREHSSQLYDRIRYELDEKGDWFYQRLAS